MAKPLIADTGPLVALLNRHDQDHAWVVTELDKIHDPLFICEAVFAECAYLLRKIDPGFIQLSRLVEDRIVTFDFDLKSQFQAVSKLLKKYHDTPMSLADACVVRMSELMPDAKVLTVDSDFFHYRKNSRHSIAVIHPRR